MTVTVTYDTTNGVNFVTVTTSAPFSTILPFVPLGSFNLTGSSRMPVG